jgi:hypothetical protein
MPISTSTHYNSLDSREKNTEVHSIHSKHWVQD